MRPQEECHPLAMLTGIELKQFRARDTVISMDGELMTAQVALRKYPRLKDYAFSAFGVLADEPKANQKIDRYSAEVKSWRGKTKKIDRLVIFFVVDQYGFQIKDVIRNSDDPKVVFS